MATNHNNTLLFKFNEVHPEATCAIQFHRTLRIPDDGNVYPLPASLGSFPVRLIKDNDKLACEVRERQGVMIPMYQSEALWMAFHSQGELRRQHAYPFALKIGTGKRSAITGKEWKEGLHEKDYVVVTVQPWLDGFLIDGNTIKQFVAAIGGQGFTVEEQLTGKHEFGGIQFECYPMKRDVFERLYPPRPDYIRSKGAGGQSVNSTAGYSHHKINDGDDYSHTFATQSFGEENTSGQISMNAAPVGDLYKSAHPASKSVGQPMFRAIAPAGVKSMGMAAGGRMRQEIAADPYGLDAWDTNHSDRCFVHLIDAMAWEHVTGEKPPTQPLTKEHYKKHNIPWFDYSVPGATIAASDSLKGIKSVTEMAPEKGYSILPENESIKVESTVKINVKPAPGEPIRAGKW